MTSNITVDELRKFAETYVAEEPDRLGADGWWQTPLLVTAPADSRFDQLPHIAADDHVLPEDLLRGVQSVIVFYIPFKKELIKENRKGDLPCRNWCLAYVQTNDLLKAGKECGQCIKACPVGALSAEGLERRLCWDRLTENRRTLDYLADLPDSTHVCGKCVALMPCSFKNPVVQKDAG